MKVRLMLELDVVAMNNVPLDSNEAREAAHQILEHATFGLPTCDVEGDQGKMKTIGAKLTTITAL